MQPNEPSDVQPREVTRLLNEMCAGNAQSANQLMDCVYKELRRLAKRRDRDKLGLFAAEGEDLVMAAQAAGYVARAVFVPGSEPTSMPESLRPIPVDDELLASSVQLASGTRAVGVYKQRWLEPEEIAALGGVTVCLWGVGEPGNVGTIIRSALVRVRVDESVGARWVVVYVNGKMFAMMNFPPYRAVLRPFNARGEVTWLPGPLVVTAKILRADSSETLLPAWQGCLHAAHLSPTGAH